VAGGRSPPMVLEEDRPARDRPRGAPAMQQTAGGRRSCRPPARGYDGRALGLKRAGEGDFRSIGCEQRVEVALSLLHGLENEILGVEMETGDDYEFQSEFALS
jgi:hypothetical protein